ncbi:MAG: sulfotransferase domain-containing protein [Cytophagia bacterium]|nr:sulfotransferase domain-containing protein [Cytophagia bacterium]
MSKKVNLFIIGAPKCGTTYLFEYLKQTVECDMSSVKEPDFFSHDLLTRNVTYYKTQSIGNQVEYDQLFRLNQDFPYHGEASVSYFTYPEVARRIHTYNPEARILILLRDPALRAFSHYKMDRRLGYINTSFDSIINREYTGAFAEQFYDQYITTGYYSRYVKTYFDQFGKNQICCIRDTTDMSHTIEQISAFLNIPIQRIPETRVNQSVNFKSDLLKSLYTSRRTRKLFKAIIPPAMVSLISTEDEKLPHELNEKLTRLFKEDQHELKRILDND